MSDNTSDALKSILELFAKRERNLSKKNFNHSETWHYAYAIKELEPLIAHKVNEARIDELVSFAEQLNLTGDELAYFNIRATKLKTDTTEEVE
tara:strand:+ start:251 stop:529 length:279 start_codon:yes stop_codon:yes gene_type:complete